MNLMKECNGAKTIGISGHIRPDGDCVGSCLALWQYLTKRMPEASVEVFLENPPSIFNEIKGFDQIREAGEDREPFDVFFAVDTIPERTGKAQAYFENAKKSINIDHHGTNPGCGDVALVCPKIGSASEVVMDLMEEEYLDRDIAMSLYIGMIHDTGIFQYTNTTPDTMRKAAKLMEFGFDFAGIIEKTYHEKTYLQAQIMGRALMESVRFLNGRCIVSVVDRKVINFYQVESNDFTGIVNQLRNIAGVDCAIFMYECGVQEYKVSLRTTEKVDAAAVVSHFGGGGHARAAGCNMQGNAHDCINNLSYYIEKELEKEHA